MSAIAEVKITDGDLRMEISGTSNRVLEVNLTKKDVKEIKVHEKDRKMYLGAKGLGLKLLYDRLTPGIDPLGEDNYLAFMMGVFMGPEPPAPDVLPL